MGFSISRENDPYLGSLMQAHLGTGKEKYVEDEREQWAKKKTNRDYPLWLIGFTCSVDDVIN